MGGGPAGERLVVVGVGLDHRGERLYRGGLRHDFAGVEPLLMAKAIPCPDPAPFNREDVDETPLCPEARDRLREDAGLPDPRRVRGVLKRQAGKEQKRQHGQALRTGGPRWARRRRGVKATWSACLVEAVVPVPHVASPQSAWTHRLPSVTRRCVRRPPNPVDARAGAANNVAMTVVVNLFRWSAALVLLLGLAVPAGSAP